MMTNADYEPGPISCKGAVFDDFRLTEHLPPEESPAVIERDRKLMSARPGFNRKLLPIRIEPETGVVYSGGRYLLDTYANALKFANWVTGEFNVDGVDFMKRPDFADITARVWHIVGAHDFRNIHTAQHVFRTEVWALDGAKAADRIIREWPHLRDQAEAQGHSSLWLLHDDDKNEVCLVTVAQRQGIRDKQALDFSSLGWLENLPSQGQAWENSGFAVKTFDRTHWVYTIWFPNTGDTQARPPLWPNSPPLPAPRPAG